MGSDESHFNVSLIVKDKVTKTVSTDHNLSEEKGDHKLSRTEVLLLTSLAPYRWAKPAHSETDHSRDSLRNITLSGLLIRSARHRWFGSLTGVVG